MGGSPAERSGLAGWKEVEPTLEGALFATRTRSRPPLRPWSLEFANRDAVTAAFGPTERGWFLSGAKWQLLNSKL